jgi:hypothetical protein
MGETNNYKEKKHLMGISFAIGAALGSLYGAFILGPALDSTIEGTAIGIAIGTGAGVSLGAFYEVGICREKMNKNESKLLVAVVIATLLLMLSTAFMAYSGIA